VKRSNRLVIFVGVLLAILAFVGIVILLNGSKVGVSTPNQKVNVLVAKQDIKIDDPVTPDKVEVAQVDPNQVVETALGSTSQVAGQPALRPVPKGAQVSKEVISPNGGPQTLSRLLKPGEKAIAFQVDRVTGLDFLIQAGDHVDIVLSQKITVLQPTADTVTKPVSEQRFETVPGLDAVRTVKAILQNKRVLYVSQTRIQTTPGAAASASPSAGGSSSTPGQTIENVIIVIAGTDQDAEAIKFAQNDVTEIGTLTAVLRSTGDPTVEKTTGLTIDRMVSQFGLQVPSIIRQLSPR
jgi:Flp pilus assembly protein CpaB